MMIYGQTRIFFTMSRDGLLPPVLSKVHPRFNTPHIVTMMTGLAVMIAAAFLPVGKLADISNSGTLFAFLVVSLAVMMLRRSDPGRHRPFRTPIVWVIAPMSVIGCMVLFWYLPTDAKLVFPLWAAIGLFFYFIYGYRKSHMKPGNAPVDDGPVLEAAPVFHEGPEPGP
jgi:APA family basic amino acid/polyamine antiporter